jgi:putative oxidoreductase
MSLVSMLERLSPLCLSVLRAVAGLLFFGHGAQKLLGWPETERVTELFSLPWWAGAIELVTGALLFLGLLTRSSAFLASGTMAFAYWMVHAPRDTFPVNNGGVAAILYCFVFLYIVFAGGGPISIDRLRQALGAGVPRRAEPAAAAPAPAPAAETPAPKPAAETASDAGTGSGENGGTDAGAETGDETKKDEA